MKSAYILFNSKYESSKTDGALRHIGESINTFAEIVPDQADSKSSESKEPEIDEYCENTWMSNDLNEEDIQNSKFKKHLDNIIENLKKSQEKDTESGGSLNKYFMPNFFGWVKAKLPNIALWSNLRLGDLSRFNDTYKEICSPEDEYSICDERRTNVTAEEFFTIKKQDTKKIKIASE